MFIVDSGGVLHGMGEFVLQGTGLEEWIVENVKGILKLTTGATTEDVLRLVVDGKNGDKNLEINCKGNLNKVNESAENLETVFRDLVTDCDNFCSGDGDLITESDDFAETVDDDFESGAVGGDFGAEYCDF